MIDRLAYWYYHPREWLKKVALMDDVYLMNSPFTFQSLEKHSAYCALIRLGMHVPDTVLVPYKNPIDNVRWAYTARNYNDPFDLAAIAGEMGYPLFMKPFDGGGWRGVSRIKDEAALMQAYDDSGRDADAPAEVGRAVRRLRPGAHHRPGVHGDALPARRADARPVRG